LYEEFETAKRSAEAASIFARLPAKDGGRFPLTGRGDVNTYALFAELFANLASRRGRAGVIVPTGIATDATTAPFFAALVAENRLAKLIDFENREAIFPDVHRSYKFCLLTIGRNAKEANFSFFLTDPRQLSDPERRFTLSADAIARINPNTKTAPVFRSRADAELTKAIYNRVPVLVDDAKGAAGNPWGIKIHSRIWHMTEDAEWFRTAKELRDAGFESDLADWVTPKRLRPNQNVLSLTGGRDAKHFPDEGIMASREHRRYVPLYEAKMIHHFDHRWATQDGLESREVTATEKADPNFEPVPRYWVPADEVANRLTARGWNRGWLMGWRNIARATDERTVIVTIVPYLGVGNSMPLLFPNESSCSGPVAALLAGFSSLTLDYVARHKIGGANLNFFIAQQLPIFSPSFYSADNLSFIVPRVLELIYTSHAMAPFAHDLGYDGPPFAWDEDRRTHLRAELDAWYARAYGLTRDELRYILDPADVMGPDYPSETFRVLKKNEIARFGEYRTARLVLSAWDRLERGELTA
jgi:hypothetical protein